jgi:S1-C subfamily serine protease
VEYTEYDVSRDERAAEEMVRVSGQMGVPVITIDGQVVIGFDRARLQALLARAGSQTPPRFGLKIADASSQTLKSGTIPLFGAFIGDVSPGSLGEKAGLRAGDIVTEVNAKRISNAADMEHALAGLRTGSIVTINFLRDSATRKSETVI